jgi:hypothetical protein
LAHSKRKHGIENHFKEILEFCEDKDSLYKREAELVNEQVLVDQMNMNIRLGGKGGWEHIDIFDLDGLNRKGKRSKYHHEKLLNDDQYKELYCKKVSERRSECLCNWSTCRVL